MLYQELIINLSTKFDCATRNHKKERFNISWVTWVEREDLEIVKQRKRDTTEGTSKQ